MGLGVGGPEFNKNETSFESIPALISAHMHVFQIDVIFHMLVTIRDHMLLSYSLYMMLACASPCHAYGSDSFIKFDNVAAALVVDRKFVHICLVPAASFGVFGVSLSPLRSIVAFT